MFQHFITLLPFSFTVLYFFIYTTRKDKTQTQRILNWMTVFAAFFLYCDAIYVTNNIEDYRVFVITDTINHFVTPLIPGLVFLMLYSYRHQRSEYIKYFWTCCIAVFYGTACLTMTLIAGFDNIVMFAQSYCETRTFLPQFDTTYYHTWLFLYGYGYYIMLTIEMLLLLVYVFYYLRKKRFGIAALWRFLFNGAEATPLLIDCWCTIGFCLLCFTRMGLGRFFWIDHPTFSVIVSALLAFHVYVFGNVGLISHMYEGTLREMLHPLMQAPLLTTAEGEDGQADATVENEDMVFERIIEVMEDGQMYRNPNVTLEDLALKLNQSTQVVSLVIEHRMACSFRDYANKLRVLHAQRYMILHPYETQDRVAAASGFVDASALSKKFRAVVGQTPREWVNFMNRVQQERSRG